MKDSSQTSEKLAQRPFLVRHLQENLKKTKRNAKRNLGIIISVRYDSLSPYATSERPTIGAL